MVFNSCEKNEEFIANSPNIISERTDHNENSVSEGERKEIVLGAERVNPFELSQINAAAGVAFGEDFPKLFATHFYVKFKPETTDDLVALHDWSNQNSIPYFDYPLLNKIEEPGDFYIDPEVSDPLFTYQYASVDVNQQLPLIPYEIIEELYINHNNPLLMATSFDMTGHTSEIHSYVMNGGLTNIEDLDPSNLLRIPDEPIECPEGCRSILVLNDLSRPFTFEWACDCTPPPPVATNECGCQFPTNRRYPSGCVRVDNDNGDEPVKIARIKIKDGWFGSDNTETDKNGCWRLDKEYSGPITARVFFENENIQVRDLSYWLAIRVMRDRSVRDAAPPYRFYRHYDAQIDRREWACSHSLNTDCNYRNAARIDNITQPRQSINVTLRAGSGGAAAPMLQGNLFNSWVSLLTLVSFPANVLNTFTTLVQPDIVNQYSGTESSRSFINTGFHEYGHASHHKRAGESFWFGYRNHIIANSGYGTYPNLNGNDGGKCALGESVANYVEFRYGSPFSMSNGGENFEWQNGFIPNGLLWDLQDVTNDPVINPASGVSISETTRGFTPMMFFDALDNPRDIKSFRDRLRTLHLSNTPNTTIEYNSVLNTYDVLN